ncbi:hypothetical protein RJI07_02670 [Mycoplasmatota bacterium WC30]
MSVSKKSVADKVKEKTTQVLKFFELSIEELSKLGPQKIENAMDEFDREILSLRNRLVELDEEKISIKEELKKHKKTKKDLIKRLKEKKI